MGLKCRASVLILVHFFFFFFFIFAGLEAVTHADRQDAAGLKQEITLKATFIPPTIKPFGAVGVGKRGGWRGGGGTFLDHCCPTRSETSGVAEEKQQLCSNVGLEFSCTFILRHRGELLNFLNCVTRLQRPHFQVGLHECRSTNESVCAVSQSESHSQQQV